MTATAREYVGADAPVTTGVPVAQVAAFAVMTAVLVAAPFLAYPVFLMKALCFALFACAFNLLIGYVGLLSFGHAVFLGTAGYAAAHSAKVWGFRPELAILFGTAVATGLGIVIGALAIRSKGIYFANITLALAQMVYFFCLQAAFTGGEDGIQSVPRGTLLGLFDLKDTLTLYFVVRADGSIKENVLVQRTAGFEDFDESARVALRAWRFAPLTGGRTGEQWGTITFHFKIEGAG